MALVFSDRVKETTTSTGTGPLTLAGAVAGFRAFSSVCADGDTAYYVVTDGTSWEVGLGTFAAGVLTRTTVLSSSNGGSAVALNPGSKDVWIDVPAAVVSGLVPTFGVGSPVDPGTLPGQVYYDTDAGNLPYFWDGSAWQIDPVLQTANAVGATVGALAGKVTPQVATGNPNLNGTPTDGSIFFYYDNTTSPYVAWVFDIGLGAWAQVA